MNADTVYRMHDGKTVLASQIITEAENAARKAAWEEAYDEKRRQWDAEIDALCAKFEWDAGGDLA